MTFVSDSNDSTENLNIFLFHFFLFHSLGMLTRKLPPLLLELYLDGFQVRLSSLQASYLLSKVRRMAAGTLVWRRELEGIVDAVVAVDAETLARWRVVVDVVGVVLQVAP